MRKLAILTVIGVALITGQAPAQARSNSAAKLNRCSTKQPVTEHMNCAKANIKHGKQLLRFLRHNLSAGTHRSRQALYKSGRYLQHYGIEQLRLAVARTRPAHYYGWLCIHSREGAWNSNTGNGYYGGLQAHRGWGGVEYMHLLSPLSQMIVAERELRKNGYSHAWLAGQWPNTYPPCANYF